MSQLVETICVLDGVPQHLDTHQARCDRASRALFQKEGPRLEALLNVPAEWANGSVKCRVLYGEETIQVTYTAYSIRQITSLKIVRGDDISYPWKFAHRPQLDLLFSQRGSADEIVIIKGEKITDAYYYNIAVLIHGEWLTPSEPLLQGTCRQRLLQAGTIREANVTLKDLPHIQMWQLFNAMTPPETLLLTPNQILWP